MKLSAKHLLSLYALALQLYPRAFRERYAAEMLDAVRLQYAEHDGNIHFVAELAWDTLRSVMREHWRAATPARPVYVVLFAVFFSALLFGISIVKQQILRRGADRQPGVLATKVGAELADGSEAAAIFGDRKQEIASDAWLESTSTFAAVYDAASNAIASNATLHGSLPQPPRGIFNVIRARGSYKVSWQPQRGIRVALTGRELAGGGFVLAGQSLIPSEARDAAFDRFMRLLWLALAAACLFIFVLARIHTLRRTI
jgi:hypothetical protein